MKKFFVTLVTSLAIIVSVLAIPAVRASAADGTLKDIPMLDSYYKYHGNSRKAYCYYGYEDGFYTYTYCSSKREKLLYKSENKFSSRAYISKDGKIVFYCIDDSVYRYSYDDDETRKIYTDKNNFYINASANGEYCCIINDESFILWHDGKTVSAKKDGDKNICGVTNDGRLLFDSYEGKIFLYSFDTEKQKN